MSYIRTQRYNHSMKWMLPILLSSLLLMSSQGFAITLTPFTAQYEVYRNNSKVGLADFQLKQENGIWYWDMKTRVTGFYRFLTRKRPFTRTQLQVINNQPQLLIEQSGDYPDKPAKHTAWFDFNSKTLYSMKESNVTTVDLPEKVYNYHSVHLIYPLMLQQELLQIKINFYRKGGLTPSVLTLERQVQTEHNSQTITVDRITQQFENSNKTMIYDFQRDSLAPLRIEQIRPGKDTTLMIRTT